MNKECVDDTEYTPLTREEFKKALREVDFSQESTKGKTCIKAAQVEVLQRDPLFKDISACGEWCAEFSTTYGTCIQKALLLERISTLKKS